MKKILFIIMCFVVIFNFQACKKNDANRDQTPPVKDILMLVNPVSDSSSVTIQGTGFQQGDKISFRLPAIGTSYVDSLVVSSTSASFFIPRKWKGNYQVILERNQNKSVLGNINVVWGPFISLIVLPTNTDLPVLTIGGIGFEPGDSIVFRSVNSASNTVAIPSIEANNAGVSFSSPAVVIGENKVYVRRNGVSFFLGNLKFPIPPVISNIVMPTGIFAPVSRVTIQADGLIAGDAILAGPSSSTLYLATGITLSGNSISFYLPKECVKENVVYVARGGKTLLGTITISVPDLNTDAYGGVVFMVNKVTGHGLVCSKHQFAQQYFGPNTTHADNPLTSYAFGKGLANTQTLVTSMATWRAAGNSWPDKTAAETVNDWSDEVGGVVFDDWFLPSKDELAELYLALSNKKVDIIPRVLNYDSYQTSSELEAWRDGAVSTVNFWYIGESVPVVFGEMGKLLPLGVIGVRAF
jgi:hypothetical protein